MRSYQQYCGLALALDRVGDRWALLVVRELLIAPRRFGELLTRLPGVASNLLAERLKAMEGEGLVARRELPAPAAATVYELTSAGHELREAVHALIRWGGRFMSQRQRAQHFSPEWLVVSLNAIRPPPRALRDGRLRFEVALPEGRVPLELTSIGVQLGTAQVPVEASLTTTAPVLLGLASGALDAGRARGAFTLVGARPATSTLRAWLFARPR